MRNRILTLMQASAIFMFLTKLPMTTVLVVILSLATIFYKLLQNKLYFDKLNNKTIVVIIAMLLYMLCRIMSQYVVGIDLYDVDIDYIVTISLAFILFVSILFHRDAYAILYAIIASSLFTGGWAIFELIFNFNTLSSRFSDPGNIFTCQVIECQQHSIIMKMICFIFWFCSYQLPFFSLGDAWCH
ncbi:hypothetical protein LF82_355 [Escherichia coli LF82]|nr:hypothetical protein LF82_355 [Escherichia coli LF82]